MLTEVSQSTIESTTKETSTMREHYEAYFLRVGAGHRTSGSCASTASNSWSPEDVLTFSWCSQYL